MPDPHATAEILVALATLIGALLGLGKWLDSRQTKRHRAALRVVETALQAMVGQLVARMQQAYEEDPKSCVTLDLATPDGKRWRIPVPRYRRVEVWEGIWLSQSTVQPPDGTLLILEAPNLASLPAHLHWESVETATVRRGTMTDLDTSRVYQAGESWQNDAGHPHRCSFYHAEIELLMRPPLPTAMQAPPDLRNLAEVAKWLP